METQRSSERSVVQRLGAVSVLAGIAAVMPAVGGFLVLGYMDTIAQWLGSHREWGPVIYAAAFAVLAGLALLPTYAQAILGGWAFGVWGGFTAALIGFFGGALIAYGIARPTAAERVTKLIDEKPKWAAVRQALLPASTGHRGALKTLGMVTLLRLPPNSPFAITNLVLASVRVPLWIYCLGTALGMAPRTFIAVWLGHTLHGQFPSINQGLQASKPVWLIAVTIGGTILVLAIIGLLANKAIERVVAIQK